MKKSDKPKPATLAVWAGEQRNFWERSTQVPVVHSVSFGYDDIDEWLKTGQGKASGHIYSRNTNPTVQAFGQRHGSNQQYAVHISFPGRSDSIY
jgi:cystathionine gamma-synthase